LSLGRGTLGEGLFTFTSLLNGPTGSLRKTQNSAADIIQTMLTNLFKDTQNLMNVTYRAGDFTVLGAGAFGCEGIGGGGGLFENEVGNTGAGGTMEAGLTGGAEGAGGTGGPWRRVAFGSGGGGLLAAGGGGGAGGRTTGETRPVMVMTYASAWFWIIVAGF